MTSVYEESDKGNLNVDLVDEFIANGHSVDVITPVERKTGRRFEINDYGRLRVIRFPCLNFRGRVNLIEKGISTLVLGYQYLYVVARVLRKTKYDLATYTTLPITYAPALRWLKRRHGTFRYLLQKDFFPQSAIDLGLMSRKSVTYRLFRRIERQLFEESDAIGVMSEKNVQYLLAHEQYVQPEQVEVCPNSIKPFNEETVESLRAKRDEVRERYGIPSDAVVYVYGGNISRAQGIESIIDIVENFGQCEGSYLLFVGGGNEVPRLQAATARSATQNVRVIAYLPKDEFDRLLAACDVGLVFLDPRFTIANIPSRMLAHLNMSQAIVAATDEYTDFRLIVEEPPLGLWGLSGDTGKFVENVNRLTADPSLREKLGENGRQFLERECNVGLSYDVIMRHLPTLNRHVTSGSGLDERELEWNGVTYEWA